MVEMMGLEPIRPFRQRILSPLRLPIPPHLHGGSCRSRTGARRVAVCCLTTWLRNQSSVKLQRFIIILKAFNECNRSIPLFISSLQIFFLRKFQDISQSFFDFLEKYLFFYERNLVLLHFRVICIACRFILSI